jgi:hypothetical protein
MRSPRPGCVKAEDENASHSREEEQCWGSREGAVGAPVTSPGTTSAPIAGREECRGYVEEMLGAFEDWTIAPEELLGLAPR